MVDGKWNCRKTLKSQSLDYFCGTMPEHNNYCTIRLRDTIWFFQKYFFFSTTIERNNLDRDTQSSEVIRIFKEGNLALLSPSAQKLKFFIENFFSKCDKIPHLLKKSLTENFIFEMKILNLLIFCNRNVFIDFWENFYK